MDDVSSNGRFKTLNEEGVFTKFPTLKRILDELTTTPNNNGCVIPDMLMKLPEYKLPLFPLLIVMAVFAIIIGPLNYWYLQRKHKQLLLVLTTPAISIVFCIIVFLFITFREGWRSHGTMVGFTLLDQTEHQATTIARAVMNAALRPSGGFRFSADEVLSFNQDSGTLEMRDEPGQVIGPSIMRTRVPLDINIRKTEPRREQIEISFSDDKATVVNGLGATIEDLIVIAPDNTVFRTDVPLQPGSTTILSAKTNPNTKTPPSFFTVEQIINQLGRNPNIDWIPPGHYFAKLKEPLFYSYGMKPDTMDATHYVIGRF